MPGNIADLYAGLDALLELINVSSSVSGVVGAPFGSWMKVDVRAC